MKRKTKSVFVMLGFAISLLFGTILIEPVMAKAPTLTLSIPTTTLSLAIAPSESGGTFATSSNMNFSVTTDNYYGYTLNIKAASSTDLVSGTDSLHTLPTSSSLSAEAFAASNYRNTWGYKPSVYNSASNSTYRPAPDTTGDTLDVVSSCANTADCTDVAYAISIGANIGLDQPIGEYSNTFVITAVAKAAPCNSSATTIGTAVCMQDMNDNVINSMVTGTQYKLYDIRDNQRYYVAKLADGKVWMTQNLDLDLGATDANGNTITLDSTNTNLKTYGSQGYTSANGYTCSNAETTTNCTGENEVITWTPSATTGTTIASWGSNSNTAPASYDRGDTYYYTNADGSVTTYTSKSACTAAHNDDTCAHYHIGNYYNFTAAVASNSTSGITSDRTVMGNSICPKGWRLPNGRTSNTASNVGYYAELNYALVSQGIMTNYVASTSYAGIYSATGWTDVRREPVYLVQSGFKNGTSNPSNAGTYALYWTSTINSGDYGYGAYMPNTGLPYPLYASSNTTRGYGLSVRCVAEQTNTGSTAITFDKNAEDATGTTANQTIAANSFAALTANGYTYADHVFDGWNTKADGSGVNYANTAKYYAAAGNTANSSVTLYAQWSEAATITFSFSDDAHVTSINFNGTDYTDGQTVVVSKGETYTISGNYAKKHGFSAWTVSAGTLGNASYPATTYTVAGDATISVTSQAATLDMASATDMATLTGSFAAIGGNCKNEVPEVKLVYDSRDNEAYYVAKLCDGKIWMLDNLRLDLISMTTTTMTAANTNASEQSISCLLTGSYNSAACSGSYTATAVNASWSNSYNTPKINKSGSVTSGTNGNTWTGSYTQDTLAPVIHGAGSNKIGIYYNYCAASAGYYCYASGAGVNDPDGTSTLRDSKYDICPAGWHMPTSTSSGEYQALYNTYANATGGQVLAFENALSAPFSGSFSSGSAYNQGSSGFFWSSTYYNTNSMYPLVVSPSYVYPSSNGYRYSGRSVRCVLGS